MRYAISVARIGAVEITGNTTTHDDVIRRELRLKPGMLVTDSGVRNDYNRLNNLGFFEKVDVSSNPGPDPKKPAYVTLKWTRQRTAHRHGPNRRRLLRRSDRYRAHRQHFVFAEQHQRNRQRRLDPVRKRHPGRRRAALVQHSVSRQHRELEQLQPRRDDLHASADELLSGLSEPRRRRARASPRRRFRPTRTSRCRSSRPTRPTTCSKSGVASTYKTGSTGFSATLGRRLSDYLRASLGCEHPIGSGQRDGAVAVLLPVAQNLNPIALTTSPPTGTTSSASRPSASPRRRSRK